MKPIVINVSDKKRMNTMSIEYKARYHFGEKSTECAYYRNGKDEHHTEK